MARPLGKNMKRDPKTGRPKRKDPKKQRAAKRAARKRKGKKQKAGSIMKRKRSLQKTLRTGRTRSGRKSFS